jgi:hypothetical protein
MTPKETAMEEEQVGWIAAIIIGGIAGLARRAIHEKPNWVYDEHCAWHRRGRCR